METILIVAQKCSVKKVFLKILQTSPENTCARDSFLKLAQVFSCEVCKIFKNNFFLWNTSDDSFIDVKIASGDHEKSTRIVIQECLIMNVLIKKTVI